MEVNKPNVYICEPAFHNNHSANAKSGSAKTRPHVTLRRRCRSECLQMIPVLGATPTLLNVDQNPTSTDDRSLQNKATNRRTIFTKSNNHNGSMQHNNHSQQPQKNHTKENMLLDLLNSSQTQNIHEGYLCDLEKYKEKQMTLNLTTNGKLGNKKSTEKSYLNGDSFSTDPNKRRVRTRSESEPHEIYNTKYSVTAENRRTYEDVSLRADDKLYSKNK